MKLVKPIAVALSLAVALPAISTTSAFAAEHKVVHRTDTRRTDTKRTDPRDSGRDHRQDSHRSETWRHRGGHLPTSYRSQAVIDWHRHGLRRPPAGHRWVRVGNDYVLVAAASGLIAGIVAATR